MTKKGNDEFKALLLDYSREPEENARRDIENRIWEKFGKKKAVLAVDMSGFSQLTQKHGIVHYLSMIRRMQITSEPIVQSYGGIVLKFEADNCFAMFDDSLGAVQASISLNHAFGAANIVTPDELDIRISCGIDYGDILVIDDEDFFGNPVNRGSKLGEDIAGPGDILLTEEAAEGLPDKTGIEFDPVHFTISGIEIKGFSVKYNKEPI